MRHNRRFLQYFYDKDTGIVGSRCGYGDEIAFPVLQFDAIGKGGVETSTGKVYRKGDFNGPMNYVLEKCSITCLVPWNAYKWTKKIPLELKNRHREFWGMKPVKACRWSA